MHWLCKNCIEFQASKLHVGLAATIPIMLLLPLRKAHAPVVARCTVLIPRRKRKRGGEQKEERACFFSNLGRRRLEAATCP